MLGKLGEVIKKATNKIANAIFLDKNLVDQIIRDLQRALIEADVNVLLVKQLSDKIRKTALDERIKQIEKKEHLIKLLHDELIILLGKAKKLELGKTQNKIMLVGLYGAGKTTTIAKLGNYFAKRGNKVGMVGLDVHRPGAPEQLQQLAERNKLTAFVNLKEKNAVKIWEENKDKLKDYGLILIDTAGRHNLDTNLKQEIEAVAKKINPTEIILVMPADIGQAAKKQAQEFKEAVKISGVIITRMDSSAKAGGALTACAETQAPVYYITTGEKINDIEEFDPERFLSRLLGMGDLQTLLEKIKSATGEKDAEAMQKKLQEGKISLEDVIEQVKSMGALGGFDKIKSMIPGLGSAKIPEGAIENQEEKIKKWEHILKSMTKEERADPEILQDKKEGNSRINRIAQGAGVHNSEIRSLLKQYDMLNCFLKEGTDIDPSKGMSQKQMMKLVKKFGKKKMMRFK